MMATFLIGGGIVAVTALVYAYLVGPLNRD